MPPHYFTSLRYENIIPVATQFTAGEFIDHPPLDASWGHIQLRELSMPDFRILTFAGNLKHNLHLRHEHDREGQTIDTCVVLNGCVDSAFSGMNEKLTLRNGEHNFIYRPVTADDHYIKAQNALNVFRFSIDRHYYASLLPEKEKWSACLRERILKKQPLSGAPDAFVVTPAMRAIIADINHSPLRGHLRMLVIEARLMEFVALQLEQFVGKHSHNVVKPVSVKDREAFVALRDFLDQTFTEPHSLRSLSRMFGLNEFKLKKGFRELFGTTIFDYLHDHKMNYARQLLLDEDVYVNEVSGRVGYKNPNHFSTAFKRKFGLNPTSLRN